MAEQAVPNPPVPNPPVPDPMAMQLAVDEVERVLCMDNLLDDGVPEQMVRGYQIGKFLHSAKQINDTVIEIERLLQQETLPVSPPPRVNDAPRQRARGYYLGKFLHAAKQMMDPQDPASVTAKAFIGFAKTTSAIAATVCNAINVFGSTVGYLIHDDSSSRLKLHPHMRQVFIVMTLAFLPFTVLTAGLAHTLKAKRSYNKMMNIVAIMLCMEAAYMTAMFSLFSYYLFDGSRIYGVLPCTIGVAVLLLTTQFVMFGRPGVWGWGCMMRRVRH